MSLQFNLDAIPMKQPPTEEELAAAVAKKHAQADAKKAAAAAKTAAAPPTPAKSPKKKAVVAAAAPKKKAVAPKKKAVVDAASDVEMDDAYESPVEKAHAQVAPAAPKKAKKHRISGPVKLNRAIKQLAVLASNTLSKAKLQGIVKKKAGARKVIARKPKTVVKYKNRCEGNCAASKKLEAFIDKLKQGKKIHIKGVEKKKNQDKQVSVCFSEGMIAWRAACKSLGYLVKGQSPMKLPPKGTPEYEQIYAKQQEFLAAWKAAGKIPEEHYPEIKPELMDAAKNYLTKHNLASSINPQVAVAPVAVAAAASSKPSSRAASRHASPAKPKHHKKAVVAASDEDEE